MKRRFVELLKKHYSQLGVVVILGLYVVLQVLAFSPVCRESDVAGYLRLAECMAEGKPLAVKETDPLMFHAHVWVETDEGMVIAKYAPGYPALMAAAYRLFGYYGMFMVSPAAGAITLIAAYLLFRMWMSKPVSLLALFFLATNQMYLFYNAYPLPHSVNLCAVTWGMFCLWAWRKKPLMIWAVATGLCLRIAPLLRPASAIFVIPTLVAVGISLIPKEGRKQRIISGVVLLVAYTVFPLIHMYYNYKIFGNVFTTGYDLTGEQWGYSLKILADNIGRNVRGMSGTCVPGFFILGILGMMLVREWTEKTMRFVWWLPLFLLYTIYYWGAKDHNASYLRFFICLFPLFIGSAFSFLDHLEFPNRKKYWVIGVLSFFYLITVTQGTIRNFPLSIKGYSQVSQKQVREMAIKHIPENAVIFTRTPIYYYLGPEKDFRVYNLQAFNQWYVRNYITSRPPSSPRRQQVRTDRFKKFYEENKKDLNGLKRRTVKSCLEQGTQVVFLLPQWAMGRENGQLKGEKLQLKPLIEWNTVEAKWSQTAHGVWKQEPREGKWGIYEVCPLIEAKK